MNRRPATPLRPLALAVVTALTISTWAVLPTATAGVVDQVAAPVAAPAAQAGAAGSGSAAASGTSLTTGVTANAVTAERDATSNNLKRLQGSTQLTRACISTKTRVISHRKAGATCAKGSKAVTFTPAKAVRLCLLPKGVVKRSGSDASCKKAGGFRTHGLGNHTNLYCAVPGRTLTWRPSPKDCTGKEKRYNLRNVPPADLTLDGGTVPENRPSGTNVGRLKAVDTDRGDAHRFRLVAGAGDTSNRFFAVNGDRIVTRGVLDHETQATHKVRVAVTDARNRHHVKVLTLRVSDVNEAPRGLVLDGTAVAENRPAGAVVGTLRASDPDRGDTLVHTLVSGAGDTDNALFEIVGAQLRTTVVLDHETAPTRSVRVRSTDRGGLSVEREFTVDVTDVNDAPHALTLATDEIAENRPAGSVVSTFVVDDEDPKLPWTFVLDDADDALDNALFAIDGQNLVLAAPLDHEEAARRSVRITVTDAEGLSLTRTFVIHVSDLPEAPTALSIDSHEVAENLPSGARVGTLSGVDPDDCDRLTFTLVAGDGSDDNALFAIDGDDLVTAGPLDHETSATRSVRVRATDTTGRTFERALTVDVTDVNEAPHAIALSNADVDENASEGTVVGAFSASDVDAGDTHTFTLVPGAGDGDNSFFDVVDGDLVTVAVLDHEQQPTRSIRVEARDAGGLRHEVALVVTVNDVNEAPVGVALDGDTVDENAPQGTVVGDLSSSDVDGDPLTFSLVAGPGDTDNDLFDVVGDQLVTDVRLDHEDAATRTVRIQVRDGGGLVDSAAFTIGVNDVNEAPAVPTLTGDEVDENAPAGTPVGDLAALDPDDGDLADFTLVTGTGSADNALFDIAGDQLVVLGDLDHETAATRTVRVRATDRGGLYEEAAFTVRVLDVDEAPESLRIDSTRVPENDDDALVGNLSATDPEGRPLTWSITGGADRALFTLRGDQLRTAVELDHETAGTHTVEVSVTDGTHTVPLVLTVVVTDVNDAPRELDLDEHRIVENAASTVVGRLSASDQDGDTLSYDLVPGDSSTHNAQFEVVGDELRTRAGLDFEAGATRTVRIAVSDGRLTQERAFTLVVLDVDEAPHTVSLDTTQVAENDATATLGPLTAVDPEGRALRFDLADTAGDNALFRLDGTTLRLGAALDHEDGATRTVRVTVTDGTHVVPAQFTVTVLDRNDAPTALELAPAKVRLDSSAGDVVGTLSATDQDVAPRHTFTDVSQSGVHSGAGMFRVEDNQLVLDRAPVGLPPGDLEVAVRVDDPWAADSSQDTQLTRTVVVEVLPARRISLSGSGVDENAPRDTAVGTLSYADGLGTGAITFALVDGEGDNADFVLDADGTTLRTTRSFDHEVTATRTAVLRATQGGASFTQDVLVTVNDVDERPVLGTSTIVAALDENSAAGTVLGRVPAQDPEARTLTWRISGRDAAFVGVDAVGQVALVGALDFETHAQVAGRPVLQFTVSVTDGTTAPVTLEQTTEIKDVNEAPTGIDVTGGTVADHAPAGTVVATLAAVDVDATRAHSFADVSVVGEHSGHGLLTVVGNEVRVAASLRGVAAGDLDLRVRVTDTALGRTHTVDFPVTVTLTATGLALAPSAIDENLTGRVGQLSATGAGGPFSYALSPAAATTDFSVSAEGDLAVTRTGGLDHEAAATHDVLVRVTDARGNWVDRSVTVTVNDVDEPLDGSFDAAPGDLREGAPAGHVLGTLNVVDPEGRPVAYRVTGSAPVAIDTDGVVTLTRVLDFEGDTDASGSLGFTLVAETGHDTPWQRGISLAVVDVNEAPTAITPGTATVDGSSADGAVVTVLGVEDPDRGGVRTWAFAAGGNPGGLFALDQNTLQVAGDLSTLTGEQTVRLVVADVWAGTTQTYSQDVVVTVQEDAGTLAPATLSVPERSGVTDVATLVSTSGTGPRTFALVPGAVDNDEFEIAGSVLRTRGSFTLGDDPTVRIRVTDATGRRWTHERTVTVTDVNDAPTDITLTPDSIDENGARNQEVGVLSTTDPDVGDTFTYTLVAGPGSSDNALVAISGARLRANEPIDHETKPSLSVRVRTRDAGGLTFEKALTIRVLDVNEDPTAITLSKASVMEGGHEGPVVGTLAVSDPDAGDSHTFAVSGTVPFDVENGRLVATRNLVRADQASWQVTVVATDSGGLTHSETFTVEVLRYEPAPVAVADSATTLGNTEVVVDVLTNDSDLLGGTLSITGVTGPADVAGTAEVVGNKVRVRPSVGVKGATLTFTYTIASTETSKTSTGTLTVAVSERLIWYVSAAAPAAGANGSSWAPYPSTTSFGTTGTSNPSGEGDEIVLAAGTYAPVALKNKQKLYGIRATVPGVRDADPAALTTIDASATASAVTVASDNRVDGLVARAATSGQAMDVGSALGGIVQARTTVIGSATRLTNSIGRPAVNTKVVSGARLEIHGEITTSGNASSGLVDIIGLFGTLVISQRLTVTAPQSVGVGVRATGSGTLNLAGGLDLATSGWGLSLTGIGLDLGGTNNRIVSTSAVVTAVALSNLAISKATFATVSGPRGIVLDRVTGQPLTITGTGAAGSGGSLGPVRLVGSPAGITFSSVALTLSDPDPTLEHVLEASASGPVRLSSSTVTGGKKDGVRVTGPVAGAAGDRGLWLDGVSVAGALDSSVVVEASAGSPTVEVKNSHLTGAAAPTGASRDGLRVSASGSAYPVVTVTGTTVTGHRSDQVQVAIASGAAARTSLIGNTLRGPGQGIVVGATGTSPATSPTLIADNTVDATSSAAMAVSASGTGRRIDARVVGNTVGGTACTGAGIVVDAELSSTVVARVSNSTVNNCQRPLVGNATRDGEVDLTGQGNVLVPAVDGASLISTAGATKPERFCLNLNNPNPGSGDPIHAYERAVAAHAAGALDLDVLALTPDGPVVTLELPEWTGTDLEAGLKLRGWSTVTGPDTATALNATCQLPNLS